MPEELRGVRGGPLRPRKRRIGPAEIEALIVLAGVAIGFAAAGALVGYVLSTRGDRGEAKAAGPAQVESGAGTSTTGVEGAGGTTSTSTETSPAPTGTGEAGVEGGANPQLAAGKKVFETAGCTTCHTLQDAGASGNVGPNLDDAKPSMDLVIERVTNGKGGMPSFKGQLSEQQIKDVATYVSTVTRGG
jgi:mono/diheme cytochrome c family protein